MNKKVINLKVSTGYKQHRMTWESRAVTRQELARFLVKVAKSDDWEDKLLVERRQAYFQGKVYCWCYNGQ